MSTREKVRSFTIAPIGERLEDVLVQIPGAAFMGPRDQVLSHGTVVAHTTQDWPMGTIEPVGKPELWWCGIVPSGHEGYQVWLLSGKKFYYAVKKGGKDDLLKWLEKIADSPPREMKLWNPEVGKWEMADPIKLPY